MRVYEAKTGRNVLTDRQRALLNRYEQTDNDQQENAAVVGETVGKSYPTFGALFSQSIFSRPGSTHLHTYNFRGKTGNRPIAVEIPGASVFLGGDNGQQGANEEEEERDNFDSFAQAFELANADMMTGALMHDDKYNKHDEKINNSADSAHSSTSTAPSKQAPTCSCNSLQVPYSDMLYYVRSNCHCAASQALYAAYSETLPLLHSLPRALIRAACHSSENVRKNACLALLFLIVLYPSQIDDLLWKGVSKAHKMAQKQVDKWEKSLTSADEKFSQKSKFRTRVSQREYAKALNYTLPCDVFRNSEDSSAYSELHYTEFPGIIDYHGLERTPTGNVDVFSGNIFGTGICGAYNAELAHRHKQEGGAEYEAGLVADNGHVVSTNLKSDLSNISDVSSLLPILLPVLLIRLSKEDDKKEKHDDDYSSYYNQEENDIFTVEKHKNSPAFSAESSDVISYMLTLMGALLVQRCSVDQQSVFMRVCIVFIQMILENVL